jgi:hypothetical protein
VQLGVALGSRLEVRGVQLGRADLAALEQPRCFLGGEPERVDHTPAPQTPAPQTAPRGPPGPLQTRYAVRARGCVTEV